MSSNAIAAATILRAVDEVKGFPSAGIRERARRDLTELPCQVLTGIADCVAAREQKPREFERVVEVWTTTLPAAAALHIDAAVVGAEGGTPRCVDRASAARARTRATGSSPPIPVRPSPAWPRRVGVRRAGVAAVGLAAAAAARAERARDAADAGAADVSRTTRWCCSHPARSMKCRRAPICCSRRARAARAISRRGGSNERPGGSRAPRSALSRAP